MNILSMLFKQFYKIEQNTNQNTNQNAEKIELKNIKLYEKVLPPVKLQCIICTDNFGIYTEHKCVLRNNHEFNIK